MSKKINERARTSASMYGTPARIYAVNRLARERGQSTTEFINTTLNEKYGLTLEKYEADIIATWERNGHTNGN